MVFNPRAEPRTLVFDTTHRRIKPLSSRPLKRTRSRIKQTKFEFDIILKMYLFRPVTMTLISMDNSRQTLWNKPEYQRE
jgi:hypothetical protein